MFGQTHDDNRAFLTGNVPLVAVLREALSRDAVQRRVCDRREAERRVKQALQNVHRFLEDGATDPGYLPPERLIVFDEAQRAWDEAKAKLGTRNRPSRLTASEPAHTLEIMGRREGWAVIIALIGNGQEINTGEAGLGEWGRVIAADPRWRAVAANRVVGAAEPSQRLAEADARWLTCDDDLDLTVPMRSVRDTAGAAWVDAVLRDESSAARTIAAEAPDLAYFVTRDITAWRRALRRLARGQRRAGLVGSSGAKRLRAEGLAAEVGGGDVPDWFLRRWPDIRASDALETAATEYACQGLELDVVGLAWGGDFRRSPDGWRAWRFIGQNWQRDLKEIEFVRNTYRVLLTRARYETVIWVPPGSQPDDLFHDVTRPASQMDAIAAHLLACGARALEDEAAIPTASSSPLLP
ncbi:DNA/RNA helicase domain-containing protein [Belnapia moabensis]|uniref:DNA/RNA helicase domain-containing protein n=1 Tax=Belnapia moabensis TaxID=365533 RepID=UPI0006936469|nr:DNA/RNA helicase domain-containing protein [Belnapia moabensis]